MRVVVTGGAGFIGSAATRSLLDAGHSVTVLDDLSTGRHTNLEDLSDPARSRLTFVGGSVLDRCLVESVCTSAEHIVHLAAHVSVPGSLDQPRSTYDVNVSGTVNVLEAARREGIPVIIASSAAVYGNAVAGPQRENQAPHPCSPYAASKLAAEQLALAWQESYGLPALSLRFFNIFGPRQLPTSAYAAVVPTFVSQALSGSPLRIHGDGRQTRDFVPVRTVAEVITCAVQEGTGWATPVNVALGSSLSLLNLVTLLGERLGRRLDVCFGPSRSGDVLESRGDATLLRTLFPDLGAPDLAQALDETVDWFRASLPRTTIDSRALAVPVR